jgi:RND family efflux transporter MFP subunit
MRIWFGIGIAVALGALVTGCKEEVAAPVPVRPVLSTIVSSAVKGNVAIVGTIQPKIKTDFSFRTLGRLIARPVNVGDTVEKGEILAAIDPAALELAVRLATAELSNGAAQFTNAAATEERQRTLLEKSVTSQAGFEAAEQTRQAAESAVVRAQANLTKAREQLGYAQLKADFGGVVTLVGAEVGQVVSPGQTIVTIARPEIREAVIDVADDVASELRIGMPFTVALQLEPSLSAQGKVREIAPQADAVTRSRRVRITLENSPEAFRLGTTVTTTIPGGPVRGPRLPASAILTKDGKTRIWLVDASTGTVAARDIQCVPDGDGWVSVNAGLEAGARVVTAGVNHLAEGQKVRIDQEGSL